MMKCQICKEEKVKVLLDCGLQSLCNRFVVDPNKEEYRHPLILGQCEACGLIQLTQSVPAEEIAPRFEWLIYNEPQEHLDNLADIICKLPGISHNSTGCGITYKDDTLLKCLKKRKFKRTWRIEPAADLGIAIANVAGETVLPRLSAKSARGLVEKHGQADVVIARHVYEHAPDNRILLAALKELVAPGGYVVFEVPDCTRLLDSKDYSMLWEEHILYFTPDTLRSSFGFTDFSLLHYKYYPYPVENALVAITQLVENNRQTPLAKDVLERELTRGNSYAGGLDSCAQKLQRYLKLYRKTKKKVAVFGAGHLASMYISLMGIADYIEFVVDDNPHKKGLYMPASCLPIRNSESLIDEKINLCLLSLSPESETKVMRKNKAFLEQGGRFASIFPASKNRLDLSII